MTKQYLINEYSISFYPSLCREFGPSGAILIQKLHGWIELYRREPEAHKRAHFRDGRWWVYGAPLYWAKQLKCLSTSTIRRTLGNVKKRGVFVTGNYNKAAYDRTLWYSIDYKALAAIMEGSEDRWKKEIEDEERITKEKRAAKLAKKKGVKSISPECDHPLDQNGQMEDTTLVSPIPILFSIPSSIEAEAAAKNPPAPPPKNPEPEITVEVIENPNAWIEGDSLFIGEEKKPHLLPPEQQALLLFPGEEKNTTTPNAEAQQECETVPIGKSVAPAPPPKKLLDPIGYALTAARKRKDKLDFTHEQSLRAFCELHPHYDFEIMLRSNKPLLEKWNRWLAGHAKKAALNDTEFAEGLLKIPDKDILWLVENSWRDGPYPESIGFKAQAARARMSSAEAQQKQTVIPAGAWG